MHYESLEAAGIGRERVVALSRGRLAAFEQLWVPSLLYGCVGGPTLSWYPGTLAWMREALGVSAGFSE